MNQDLYDRLVHVARSGEVTRYGDVAPLVGLDMSLESDRIEIGELLDEISTFENQNGRPLLSAVVIRVNDNIPGEGFFKLAGRLGLATGRANGIVFWAHELTRVHRHWQKSVSIDSKSLFKRLVISQLDLSHARECAEQILERDLHRATSRNDERLLRCLNTALIVSYWRPFSGNRGADGRKESLPKDVEKELLSRLSEEEKKLHQRIGVARNTEQAHADARPRQVNVSVRKLGTGKLALPISRDPFVPLSLNDTVMLSQMIDKLSGVLAERQSQLQQEFDAEHF